MNTRSLTAALALAALATATAATLAAAAPAERYDCHAVQGDTFAAERSCAEGDARRRYKRPTSPRPQHARDWRDQVFDQALSSGAGGDGGGGNR